MVPLCLNQAKLNQSVPWSLSSMVSFSTKIKHTHTHRHAHTHTQQRYPICILHKFEDCFSSHYVEECNFSFSGD